MKESAAFARFRKFRPDCATAFPPMAAGEGFGAGAPETFTRSRGATLRYSMQLHALDDRELHVDVRPLPSCCILSHALYDHDSHRYFTPTTMLICMPSTTILKIFTHALYD